MVSSTNLVPHSSEPKKPLPARMTIGNMRSSWREIDLNWQQRQKNSANNSDLNLIQIESFIKDRQPVWGFSGEVCHRRIQGAGVWPLCCQRWSKVQQRQWSRCQLTNLSHPFPLICPANVLCIHMHQERHVYLKLYFLVVELMKDIKFTSLLIDGLGSFNVL